MRCPAALGDMGILRAFADFVVPSSPPVVLGRVGLVGKGLFLLLPLLLSAP